MAFLPLMHKAINLKHEENGSFPYNSRHLTCPHRTCHIFFRQAAIFRQASGRHRDQKGKLYILLPPCHQHHPKHYIVPHIIFYQEIIKAIRARSISNKVPHDIHKSFRLLCMYPMACLLDCLNLRVGKE